MSLDAASHAANRTDCPGDISARRSLVRLYGPTGRDSTFASSNERFPRLSVADPIQPGY